MTAERTNEHEQSAQLDEVTMFGVLDFYDTPRIHAAPHLASSDLNHRI